MSREHLDSAALARAVVEGQSVLDSEHLSSCAQCQEELAALQTDLARLGRRAREAAPRSGASFIWPQAPRTVRAQFSPRIWAPAAGALAMVLLLAVVWIGVSGESVPSIASQMREIQPWSEFMEDDSDRLGGFAGFLVAENSTSQDHEFFSSGDEYAETGVEGVIMWSGTL